MPTQDDLIKLAPPNNIEAEQAVLGSMMSKASAVAEIGRASCRERV